MSESFVIFHHVIISLHKHFSNAHILFRYYICCLLWHPTITEMSNYARFALMYQVYFKEYVLNHIFDITSINMNFDVTAALHVVDIVPDHYRKATLPKINYASSTFSRTTCQVR